MDRKGNPARFAVGLSFGPQALSLAGSGGKPKTSVGPLAVSGGDDEARCPETELCDLPFAQK